MKRLALSTTVAMALTGPVWANSDLLIIGNGDPSLLQRLTRITDLSDVTAAFEARGAEVSLATTADAAGMRDALRSFMDGLDATTDDVGIVLTGQIVSTVAGSYLLPSDRTGPLTLSGVLTEGFALDAVYAVAAAYPGRALIVLGEVEIETDVAAGLSVSLPQATYPKGSPWPSGRSRPPGALSVNSLTRPGAMCCRSRAQPG